jgi:hypothetical protein
LYTKYIDLQQGYNNLTYLEGYTTKRGGKRERDRQARARIHGAHTTKTRNATHTIERTRASPKKKGGKNPYPPLGLKIFVYFYSPVESSSSMTGCSAQIATGEEALAASAFGAERNPLTHTQHTHTPW